MLYNAHPRNRVFPEPCMGGLMMTDNQSPTEFKSAGLRGVPWSIRIGLVLVMAVFGAAIPFLSNLVARSHTPDNPPPALYALCGALMGVGFLLVIRANHRGWRYVLTESALELRGPRNTTSIAYPAIEELLVDNSRVRGRGVYVKTSQASYSAFPDSPNDFAALLSSRTGVPLKPYTMRLHWPPAVLGMIAAAAVCSIALLRTKGSPSLLAGIALIVAGPAFMFATFGTAARRPGASAKVARGMMWLAAAAFAFMGIEEVTRWHNSATAAADKASISRPLSRPLTVSDARGVSFTVPDGWRVGQSTSDSVRWVVLSGRGETGDVLLFVSVSMSPWPAPLPVATGSASTASEYIHSDYPRAIADAVDKATIDYKGDLGHLTGVFRRASTPEQWGILYSESIITRNRLSPTFFRIGSKAAVGVTIEKGSDDDLTVIGFLDSVEVDGTQVPYAPPDSSLPLEQDVLAADDLG